MRGYRSPESGSVVEQLIGAMLEEAGSLTVPSRRLGGQVRLARQFGVNRKTLRSAVRELERQGIVRVTSGRSGGVVVVREVLPKPERDLIDHLILSDLPMPEVVDVANRLFAIAADIVATRANQHSPNLQRVLKMIADPPEDPDHLERWTQTRLDFVGATGNCALLLLYRVFMFAYTQTLAAELHLGEHHRPRALSLWVREKWLYRCVEERDPEAAREAAQACAVLEQDLLRISLEQDLVSRTLRPQHLFRENRWSGKLAHQTLRAVHAAVHEAKLPAGSCLGNMRSMAAEFGVSLDVMRDTLELGRQQGLVSLRRGRNGGVFVAEADAAGILESATGHLRGVSSREEIGTVRDRLGPVASAQSSRTLEIVMHILNCSSAGGVAREYVTM